MVLTLSGALLGLLRKEKSMILIMLWTVLLFLIANPVLVGLPGTGLVNNFAILIALYIPTSVLAGFFVAHLIDVVRSWFELHCASFASLSATYGQHLWRGYSCFIGIFVLIVALLGARDMLSMLDRRRALVLESDEVAMDWIKNNTRGDAKFLINTYVHLPGQAIGSDAGYWIPLFTGRRTTVPPMNYVDDGSLEYIAKVNALVEATIHFPNAGNALSTLGENGITHVYIGKRGGNMRPESLMDNPNYQLVYHRDGVWIFEVNYEGANELD